MRRRLTLDDIADVRAYERERDQFRRRVIDLKRRRRVHLGTIMTFVFENRDTIRFQIQEMARVEQLTTDAAIQGELDIYNPMIPEPGQLCATMFIELTTDDQMHEWLPKLAGVEQTLLLRLPDGARPTSEVRAVVDAQHAQGLTRETVTAAVHYLRFTFSDDQVAAFAAGPVRLACDHPAYREDVELSDAVRAELLADLRP